MHFHAESIYGNEIYLFFLRGRGENKENVDISSMERVKGSQLGAFCP